MTGHDSPGSGLDPAVAFAIAVGLAAVVYLGAVVREHRRGTRTWPSHRTVLFVAGVGVIIGTLVGPLARLSHTDFAAHMWSHLLVGMLAPLLLVLSAPVTLALRSLHVVPARRLSRLLASPVPRFLSHPIPAAGLSVGSLWVLYATPLSALMIGNEYLHYLLLAHFFAAGYLFTASMVGVDPAPHRPGFRLRLGVLVIAVAAHSTLAKHVAMHPPQGIPAASAEAGAQVMYYVGDLLEFALIVVFFAQWYVAARPRPDARRHPESPVSEAAAPPAPRNRG
ncbi:cytochrome c oxidase assembly protein [Marisediminicola senii]|uniref:cytochrome c oxidase assembly protein n=1 Tax=Marisediminicola senii TaxID=2711233 RepID=UPI0013EB32EB|nr:cytochrome c oxidase assembly protein [Marisediminicola senii]